MEEAKEIKLKKLTLAVLIACVFIVGAFFGYVGASAETKACVRDINVCIDAYEKDCMGRFSLETVGLDTIERNKG